MREKRVSSFIPHTKKRFDQTDSKLRQIAISKTKACSLFSIFWPLGKAHKIFVDFFTYWVIMLVLLRFPLYSLQRPIVFRRRGWKEEKGELSDLAAAAEAPSQGYIRYGHLYTSQEKNIQTIRILKQEYTLLKQLWLRTALFFLTYQAIHNPPILSSKKQNLRSPDLQLWKKVLFLLPITSSAAAFVKHCRNVWETSSPFPSPIIFAKGGLSLPPYSSSHSFSLGRVL